VIAVAIVGGIIALMVAATAALMQTSLVVITNIMNINIYNAINIINTAHGTAQQNKIEYNRIQY